MPAQAPRAASHTPPPPAIRDARADMRAQRMRHWKAMGRHWDRDCAPPVPLFLSGRPEVLLPCMDVADRLSRLEASGVEAGPHVESEPRTAEAAAARWVASWRPGGHKAPSMSDLAQAYEREAERNGWLVDRLRPELLGATLKRLGFDVRKVDSRRHPAVSKATCEALWALCPGVPRTYARKRHHPAKKDKRADAPTFHPIQPRWRPVVDPWGAVYSSAYHAGRALGVHQVSITVAIARGGTGAGRPWRYMTTEEVARVPMGTRCGERLDWLAWYRAVTVHCAGCRCSSTPTPPPPGLPPTPL